MAIDLQGMLMGLASPDAAANNYFQTRELKKRLKIEQEAKDAAADKAKESERNEIAAAVGKQEVLPEETIPGVSNPMTGNTTADIKIPALVRPSYTNAAMLQAQRTAAPVQEAANRFTTAQGVAPYTREMGATSAESTISGNRMADAQSKLARDNAEIELGQRPDRLALAQSTARRKQAESEAGVSAAQLEGERSKAELAHRIPQLAAAYQAGKFTLGNQETTASMKAGLPEATANASRAEADLKSQEATQNRITGKLSSDDMRDLAKLQVDMQKATGNNMIAKAEAERAISAIKSGAIKEAIDPKTRAIDWAKVGVKSEDVIQLALGYLKGGNMMQNWLGNMMPDQSVNPYSGLGGVTNPSPRPTTAGSPKVGQPNSFSTLK